VLPTSGNWSRTAASAGRRLQSVTTFLEEVPEAAQARPLEGTGQREGAGQPRRELRLKLAALCEPDEESPGLEVV
jgi:hypothetical protein